MNPSFSGPEPSCADRTCTVCEFSANDTTVSPPSRCSMAFVGRNLYAKELSGREVLVDTEDDAYRQTTLMLVDIVLVRVLS